MALNHDEYERLEYLTGEIQRGWILYGLYMDSKSEKDPIAISIRSILERLTKEKAALELRKSAEDVVTYVAMHDGERP